MKNNARLAEDVHAGHSFLQLFSRDLCGLDTMLNGAAETNEAQPVPGRVHRRVNGAGARTGWLPRVMFTVQPHVKNKHASETPGSVCACVCACTCVRPCTSQNQKSQKMGVISEEAILRPTQPPLGAGQ